MSKQCEIIQDLLPLYVDDICSQASREMIDEHITSCSACSELLDRMRSSEIEDTIKQEGEQVISRQRKLFQRKSAFAGAVIAGILMIPVIVCLIVNLAVGNGMGWFFIVLASLLLVASLVVVPLMVVSNKALWTITLSTAALILLLVVIGLTSGSPVYWRLMSFITLPVLLYIWVMFVIIRFVPLKKPAPAGLCCILTGCVLFSVNNLYGAILGYQVTWPVFYPLLWNGFTIDGNVKWLCLLAGIIVGIIFLIVGIVKGVRKR